MSARSTPSILPARREFAGAAEDQRRLRTFSPASGNGAVLPLPHSVQGLTSVETGDRWSSGGRCCQRFSRFRRAATRYYAAEPARTDLHRSAHRDAASPAAVAVPWHSRNVGVPPLVLRCSSGHTVHLRQPPSGTQTLAKNTRSLRSDSAIPTITWVLLPKRAAHKCS